MGVVPDRCQNDALWLPPRSKSHHRRLAGAHMRWHLALAGAVSFAGWMVPAVAADETLQEVVVTAEKRSERLQDVPAAITAVSGESLDQMHLQGNADLAQRVPSLAFDVLSPGESTLTMRGLGTSYG